MSYSKFQVSQEFIDNSHVNAQTYENLYKESLENPEKILGKASKPYSLGQTIYKSL